MSIDARPLVVIDPEDAEQVERLFRLFWVKNTTGRLTDDLQAALREFARPTPPKPDEPQIVGAIVADRDGDLWVRRNAGQWEDLKGPPGDLRTWRQIAEQYGPLRVLSPGVEAS